MVRRSFRQRLRDAAGIFFADRSNGPSFSNPGYPRVMTTPVANPFNPTGSSGTISYAGYPSEEYLSTLRGRQRADKFDEMRRSDPQIKLCLTAVKNPIKAATWEIEPGDESDEAKADAELADKIFFKDMDFVQFLSEATTCVDFGHSIFEPIEKIVTDDPKLGSYHSIDQLAFRSQRTIDRWNLNPENGRLLSVTQLAFGDLMRYVDISSENLLVFSIDREGSNYEGVSMLRPCYGPWFRKNEYLKLNAIGIEKFAVPTPLAEIPAGKENTNQYSNLIDCLESYTTHQNNYLTYPEGWKINLNTNTYDPSKVEMSIDSEDRRMVKAFLANFLELGMNTTGSYAMSNNLSDFFLSSLEHVAEEIKRPLNRWYIPRLIQMNRGKRMVYPRLKSSNISDRAGKELAEVLKYLGGETQFIIADDAMEDHLRKRYRLPKKSLEGQRPGKPAPDKVPLTPGVEPTLPTTLTERIRLAEAKRKRLNDG